MKFMDALKNMSQLQAMTKTLLISNTIMAAGLVYGIVALNVRHERIILIPPSLDKKAEIAWKSADKEYIKSFAMYLAVMVGNMQPKSVGVIVDSVSSFMDPRIYNDFRHQLLQLAEDPLFKASGAVTTFSPSSIQYEAETGRVFVTGGLVTATAGAQKYQKNVTYEIGIEIREGRPWVVHFLSYEGTVPHTVSWFTMKSARDKSEIPDYAMPIKQRKGSGAEQQSSADLGGMRMKDGDVEKTEDPIVKETPASGASSTNN
jgi:conjugal transfer pilus assembly protein TraE